MAACQHLSDSLLADLGINLRSRNIGVREDDLDGSEVRAVVEYVSGSRVPEHMRADVHDLDSLGQRVCSIYRKNKNKFRPGQEQVASVLHSRASEIGTFFGKIAVPSKRNPASLGERRKEVIIEKGLCAVNY